MLNKKQLEDFRNCLSFDSCNKCSFQKTGFDCAGDGAIVDYALELLNRLETAETILRDVLASGNIASCRKEIEGFLREGNKC
jgi:hypothetical protein